MKHSVQIRKVGLLLQTVHLQCLDSDKQTIPGAFASGFVVREDDAIWLYTCWHVVTGVCRYPLTIGHRPPNRKYLRITLQNSESSHPGIQVIGGRQEHDIALYAAHTQVPLWEQDKSSKECGDLDAIGINVPISHDLVRIRLPKELSLSSLHVFEMSENESRYPELGDKLYIVGYPYGYSALGPEHPTPIVLTRHIAATSVAGRQNEMLLDGAGAPGMSGGPAFLERNGDLSLVGVYTGLVYPDAVIDKNERVTALGTICSMQFIWVTKEGGDRIFGN